MKSLAAIAIAAAVVGAAGGAARADAHELTARFGPEAGVTRLADAASSDAAQVWTGGLAAGLSYGVTNRLALDAELAAGTCGEARYADVTVDIGGTTQPAGTLARTSRYGRALVGASLRLGVSVIPTLGVAVGVGTRMRGAGAFSNADVMGIEPDDDAGGAGLELLASARAGLDVRFDAHWLAGATVAATRAWPSNGAAADALTAQLHIAYAWYP